VTFREEVRSVDFPRENMLWYTVILFACDRKREGVAVMMPEDRDGVFLLGGGCLKQ
jgi:hypothetical protein